MDDALQRPFYFIVVLWGERFRDYLLEYCVPSLLSPGNLPALASRQRSKLLIATTQDDWAAIKASVIFAKLAQCIEPEFIEIPPCPPDRSSYDHMGIGHKRACELAFRDSAYAAILTPDCMLSDGTVARLQEFARSGCQLVIAAALRFDDQLFLGHLRTMGVLADGKRSESGRPLVISGRQMAYAAVNGLHSETLALEWNAPGFMPIVAAAWWRVPGEDGILLHSLSWAPVLFDYGALPEHDLSVLDKWTLDGDYIFNNLKHLKNIHVVQDSDELFLASWGPPAGEPLKKRRVPFAGHQVAKAQFGSSFKSAFFDPFKRSTFFLPVRWHAEPLNNKWQALESQVAKELLRYVTPPNQSLLSGATGWGEKTARVATHALVALFVTLRPIFIACYYPRAVWRKVRQALRGDRASIRQLLWYVRLFGFNKY